MKPLRQKILIESQNLLKTVIKTLSPKGKTEWILFISFVACYAVCGLSLIFSSNILFNTSLGAGSYLGYDNLFHYETSGGFLDIGHPFINLFHFAKFVITKCISSVFGSGSIIIFCVLLMNVLISLALLVVYKYLKNIVQLSIFRSILLTVFCGSFFTVIILSFTTESYPFSFLFLMLSLFILSKKYLTENKFNFSTVLFFEFLCGGITITNAIKPLLAFLLNNDRHKTVAVNLFKAVIPFAVCTGAVLVLYSIKTWMIDNGESSIIAVINNILSYLHSSEKWLKEAFVNYWSSSFLAAPLTAQSVGSETVLRPSPYPYLWHYILSGSLLLIFLLSLFLNRSNTLVKLLFFYMLTDIVIHFIFGYGLNEAIIFGGHWLFLIPILTGWMYHFIKRLKQISLVLDIYISLFTLLLMFNNITEILRSFFGFCI